MRSPGLTRVVQPCHMMNAIPVPARSNKRKVGKEIQRQMPHLKPRFQYKWDVRCISTSPTPLICCRVKVSFQHTYVGLGRCLEFLGGPLGSTSKYCLCMHAVKDTFNLHVHCTCPFGGKHIIHANVLSMYNLGAEFILKPGFLYVQWYEFTKCARINGIFSASSEPSLDDSHLF